LNKGLFDPYKARRDENKVGFNRVDLEKLAAWLEERAGQAAILPLFPVPSPVTCKDGSTVA
jgi:hypothetical protein